MLVAINSLHGHPGNGGAALLLRLSSILSLTLKPRDNFRTEVIDSPETGNKVHRSIVPSVILESGEIGFAKCWAAH